MAVEEELSMEEQWKEARARDSLGVWERLNRQEEHTAALAASMVAMQHQLDRLERVLQALTGPGAWPGAAPPMPNNPDWQRATAASRRASELENVKKLQQITKILLDG